MRQQYRDFSERAVFGLRTYRHYEICRFVEIGRPDDRSNAIRLD